jgi:hypothetical protein
MVRLGADPRAAAGGVLRFETKAVLQLVAGAAAGKRATIKLETEDPTGAPATLGELPVTFLDEPDAGLTVQIDWGIDFVHEGLYWLNVYIVPDLHARARLLTRIPLNISFPPAPAAA